MSNFFTRLGIDIGILVILLMVLVLILIIIVLNQSLLMPIQIMYGVLMRFTCDDSPGWPAIIDAAAHLSAMRGATRQTPSPPAE